MTKHWGSYYWDIIHRSTSQYPEHPTILDVQRTQYFLNYILAQINNICHNCGYHFYQYMFEHPPILSSRLEYRLWSWNFHNAVNERIGKKIFHWSEFNNRY